MKSDELMEKRQREEGRERLKKLRERERKRWDREGQRVLKNFPPSFLFTTDLFVCL